MIIYKKCSKQKNSLHQLQIIKDTELQSKSNREQLLTLTLKQKTTGFSKVPG